MKVAISVLVFSLHFLGSINGMSLPNQVFSINNVFHHKHVRIKIEIGDCKECNRKLEKSLIRINGIESVEFLKKSKTLNIVYDPLGITEAEIHQKIADLGYNTELVKATEDAYNKLMECCKYER